MVKIRVGLEKLNIVIKWGGRKNKIREVGNPNCIFSFACSNELLPFLVEVEDLLQRKEHNV